MRLRDAPLRAEHRATRHVGRLTKYNTLTGNTWGVSSPVFTRNHPPGTSRSEEHIGGFMIRVVTSMTALFLLGGCMQTAAMKTQINAEDNAKCRSYGLKQGSQAYAQCRLRLDQTRAFQEAKQKEFYNQMTITGLQMMAAPPPPPPAPPVMAPYPSPFLPHDRACIASNGAVYPCP